MQLSTYSDYSLRVLMYAALRDPEWMTVDEVAGAFGISRHHIAKIVHDLRRSDHLQTQRGIGGGFRLGRTPGEICLGDIVRLGEESETVMDCRDQFQQPCRIFPACRLKGVFDEAAAAFFSVLDSYTLADLVRQPVKLCAALNI